MGELFSFSNPDFHPRDDAPANVPGALHSNQIEDSPMQLEGSDGPQATEFFAPEIASETICDSVEAIGVAKTEERIERRKRRRALISAQVRVRGVDLTHGGPDEILTTINASRIGILFETSDRSYRRGMELAVTFPYSGSSVQVHAEQPSRVSRVLELPDGRLAVAVAFGVVECGDLIDASGRKLAADAAQTAPPLEADSKKPMVLAVDADLAIREMVKAYLTGEGYDVIAVSSNSEAREVLKMFTPALVIAEIEGEGLPGYDLCAHVKTTEHLKSIPVMLMTSSAYPSDYSSAHSLGAVVCIAKPFRQERFGHVVRLLAPLLHEKEHAAPARSGDPTRRHSHGNGPKSGQASNPHAVKFQIRKRK